MNSIFIFLFLVLFPFGQIIRIGIIQPIDIIVGLAAIYSIVNSQKKPEIFKYLQNFLFIAACSWIFSIFTSQASAYGGLYLLRLFAYSYFFIYVWNFASTKLNRMLLIKSLMSLSIISSLFGWFQFFIFPDLKPFFTWGWDEHLYRLAGTFLDPTFLGLIIVFGLLISIRQKSHLLLSTFLLVSLAFTYSRASYLAFIGGIIYLLYRTKSFKYALYLISVFLVLIFILPTQRNHSVELFRKFSVVARVENYKETLQIFKKSPVFGIGYNNLCYARNKFIGIEPRTSHSCSGSDSSLLFILATTGLLGLFSFIHLVSRVHLNPSFVAVFIHSLFSNSLFYPWIMGYLLILLAVNLRGKSNN